MHGNLGFGRRLTHLLLLLATALATARADLLLPPNLVPLSSRAGQSRLLDADYRGDYFLLGQHFVTQINDAYCGPASSVMVLNALNTPRPAQDPLTGFTNPQYAYYNQVNVFDNATEAVIPQTLVRQEGMALKELSMFLGAHQGVASTFKYSDPSQVTVDAFRDAIVTALEQPDMFVIVNFDRSVVLEHGGGHHSPLAAYHKDSDSVLVLDVSRYKYVAWWVPVAQLYQSTSETLDSASNLTRGLAFVWSSAQYGNQLGSSPITIPPGLDNGLPRVQATMALETTGIAGDSEKGDGMSTAAVSILAVGMLVAGAGLGLMVALVWRYGRRERSALAPTDSGEVEVAGRGRWPSAEVVYRDGAGFGAGGYKGGREERGLLVRDAGTSSDGSSMV